MLHHFLSRTIIAGALFCAFITACGNPEKEKLSHVARGGEYLKEKSYAEARIEFHGALQMTRSLSRRMSAGRVRAGAGARSVSR